MTLKKTWQGPPNLAPDMVEVYGKMDVIEPLEKIEWDNIYLSYEVVPSEQGKLLLEFIKKNLLKKLCE